MVAIAPGEVPGALEASDGAGRSLPRSLRAGQVLLLVESVLWLVAAAWMIWRSATGLGSVNSLVGQCQQRPCGGLAALALLPIGMADSLLGVMLAAGVLFALVANVGLGCGVALTRRVQAARVIPIVIASLGLLAGICLLGYVPPAATSRDWPAAIVTVWAPPRIAVVLLGAATVLANLGLIYLLGFAGGTIAAFHRPPPPPRVRASRYASPPPAPSPTAHYQGFQPRPPQPGR